jgi:Tfp pilus assembly protein PilV
MGLATHLGPWLLGTVKNTTGTTAGTIRNVGATAVAQFKTIAYGDTTANTTLAVIPAGSAIQNIQLNFTTAYTTTNPTFTFYVNGVAITGTTVVTAPAVGSTGIGTVALGSARPDLVSNVGTTDAVISFTQSNGGGGTGAITASIAYIVRQADGTIAPTYATGP